MDRNRDAGPRPDLYAHHHPRNLTLPPLPSPFPPLLTQRPAPYNAHIHPVPSPSQLDPIHPPPPASTWRHGLSSARDDLRRDERRDDMRLEYPPVESGNAPYASYSGYGGGRRDTYADSRASSARSVPTVAELPKDVDDNMPPTSDFVKKLFKSVFSPCSSHPLMLA